jgi:CheY-like chemotaxis protein
MSNPRILIIDDDQDHLDMLHVELSRQYDVLTARDGLDGYALAVYGGVDAIVLDVAMPLVDGWTVLQKLRNNPDTRTISVIILTALELEVVKSQALRFGVRTVIRKPVRNLKGIGEQIAKAIAPADS